MERSVTLEQMLSAREARQARLGAALVCAPLVSFTMNIAGPEKNSLLIRRGFLAGRQRLEDAFAAHGITLTLLEETDAVTGCEALYAAAGCAITAKALCAACEDADELGRLFDMDVIDADGRRITRGELGLRERGCLVCGAAGRGCAARRVHSVEQLQRETNRRLHNFFREADKKTVADLATQSLLDEVRVTPKPGLVDRNNSGSHTDMDLALFEKSAAALAPYWKACVNIGMESATLAPEETFARLRRAGLKAEQTMLAATGGVNTHKGAIFLLGILCGAVGRLWRSDEPCRDAKTLCGECVRMTAVPLGKELDTLAPDTAGAQFYLRHGLRGARGEVMDGLPGVWAVALPVLRDALACGCGREHAAAVALLHLIARGTDTNMVKRGGMDGAAWGAQQAKDLLQRSAVPKIEDIAALDEQFIEKNLSPGGCADLLALTLFLHEWDAHKAKL
ncbi:MAG: triphosphoribosyl-dephospho-CoA synthase CitG [Oscillospiraceae bacterium]|nr:triphosphoribosyl-dephospho-CoA synthase CitG [Oscillospiraceae bacterium]